MRGERCEESCAGRARRASAVSEPPGTAGGSANIAGVDVPNLKNFKNFGIWRSWGTSGAVGAGHPAAQCHPGRCEPQISSHVLVIFKRDFESDALVLMISRVHF